MQVRILVLCTGNSCRSQMAEGFLRAFGNGTIEVYSAGITPKGVHPMAAAVMREAGVDISSHTSNHINDYQQLPFNYVITVCDHAAEQCPIFPGSATRLHWPSEDPAHATGTETEIRDEFRRIRDQIQERCREWVSALPQL